MPNRRVPRLQRVGAGAASFRIKAPQGAPDQPAPPAGSRDEQCLELAQVARREPAGQVRCAQSGENGIELPVGGEDDEQLELARQWELAVGRGAQVERVGLNELPAVARRAAVSARVPAPRVAAKADQRPVALAQVAVHIPEQWLTLEQGLAFDLDFEREGFLQRFLAADQDVELGPLDVDLQAIEGEPLFAAGVVKLLVRIVCISLTANSCPALGNDRRNCWFGR